MLDGRPWVRENASVLVNGNSRNVNDLCDALLNDQVSDWIERLFDERRALDSSDNCILEDRELGCELNEDEWGKEEIFQMGSRRYIF
jgi:hypothetical protein